MNWTTITDDGDNITSPMPASETVVEVLLKDGSTALARYDADIMEPGDWDFVPADEPDGDSLADRVTAWRPVAA